MERVFFLDYKAHGKLYLALYQAVISEILEGTLRENERMPSVRQLAKSLNVSKTTVENAYSQLVAEGYLYTKPQKGYYVMSLGQRTPKDKIHEMLGTEKKVNASIDMNIFDFRTEYVESSNFDLGAWKRSLNKVLNEDEMKLFQQGAPFGEEELKDSIGNYFSRVRGIRATNGQIIIGSGISSLLRPLGSFFKHQGYCHLQMEDPGFHVARDVFTELSYEIHPIGLKNKVLDVDELKEVKSIVFASPSYQFPYGEVMPVGHRYRLLEWARRNHSFIIEDDYNNELRYIGKPVPSLQGMDPYDCVIYFGSFSTILIPSIRISFMVLPKRLLPVYEERNRHLVQGSSKLEQLALSKYIESGDLAKHIRKIRKSYRIKNQAIQHLLTKHLKEFADVEIEKAGVTAVLHLYRPVREKEFRILCEEHGLQIPSMNEFSSNLSENKVHQYKEELLDELVLNYRGIESRKMEKAILMVKEILCRLS
ncbi:MAG: PLP-dependent aminotransferase family protein [Vallitaleaceae bacterium]|nr:PLP-dependent aminotransferase family protein [Vallitaleaceae bacterium]